MDTEGDRPQGATTNVRMRRAVLDLVKHNRSQMLWAREVNSRLPMNSDSYLGTLHSRAEEGSI